MKELIAALAKAQSVIKSASKASENTFFKDAKGKASKYADLSAVWDVCREPLTSNGLAVTQTMDFDAAGAWLVTTLHHVSGDSISSKFPLRPTKPDMQGLMAAMTYARRGGLSAIVGVVADEDDDGNAASGNKPQEPQGTITREQCETLLALLKNAGKDPARLCEYYKIDAVSDLPAREYVHATAMMKAAAKKAEAKQ
jgi:hypothetical protein